MLEHPSLLRKLALSTSREIQNRMDISQMKLIILAFLMSISVLVLFNVVLPYSFHFGKTRRIKYLCFVPSHHPNQTSLYSRLFYNSHDIL